MRRLPLLLGLTTLVFACQREHRDFRGEKAPADASTDPVTQSALQPGGALPPVSVRNEYDDNAYAVSQGKRLFQQMNCSGCHANGGGGIGPPLLDDEWIYGSAPENIFTTIVEGRPNGMPSFRGKIPTQQVWQLVSYVRSMSGMLRKDVAPGRDDDMQVKKQEQSGP